VDFEGTIFEIRVAEDLYVPPASGGFGFDNYPYPLVAGLNDTTNNTNAITEGDRTNKIAIPPARNNAIENSVLQWRGRRKYLASGTLTAVAGVDDPQSVTPVEGVPIQTDNDKKKQRYIDIELIDLSPTSGAAYGSVFSKSIKGYVELAVTTASATSDLANTTAYLYTEGKRAFNEFYQNIGGVPVYRVNNANIKTFPLKPGVNELYLQFFSNTREP
jgi:hypothetical protein